jgi:endonuclease/exonuclease/phosphatase family metal-dependent hydrolase
MASARAFFGRLSRRHAACAVTLLTIGGLAMVASDHRSLPSAQGTIFHGTVYRGMAKPRNQSTRRTLRVASFNIHSGRNAAGEFNLNRIAELLGGYDLVGLNEVRGAYQWQHGDQAEQLGRKLDMPWLFAPTTRRWLRDDFGNGALCSLPIVEWQRIPLAGTRGKGHRNYLHCTLDHQGQSIAVLVTHLDRVQDRAAQLTSVIDAFLALPAPAIMMGDLNTLADDPQLVRLLSRDDVHDAVAEGLGRQPPQRIDWIFTRGLRGVASGVERNGASDHPLVWAELELIETSTSN